jgi:glycosyltransferase involved in cell wall biosynthesis
MPLVSTVIPTRNRAHLLERALRAVRRQVDVDLEVIVVDDGSTDATSRVVAEALDDRIRYIRNATATGVSGARNRGITAARGEWLAFLDDDDLWAPEKLTRQLRAAVQTGRQWAYTGDVNVDENLRVLSGGPPPEPSAVVALLPRWNPLSSGGSNVIVHADLLARVGGFDPTLRRTEDWDLWIRIARTGPPACVRQPLVAYRFHVGNVAADPQSMVDEARQLAARYRIPVDLAAMHRRAAWAALRGGRRGIALAHYTRAVMRGDVRSVGRAIIGLVHPAVGSDRLFDLLPRDLHWVAEAQRWLAASEARAQDCAGSHA